jgi:hypothetical protein
MLDELEFRFTTESDVPWLAKMNQQLIRDEGHRNKMTLPELEQRMSDFLQNEYNAVIVSFDKTDIGYVLYKQDPEWLKNNPWKKCERIRTDVLVDNVAGIDFWKAVGFKEYCITLEMENH